MLRTSLVFTTTLKSMLAQGTMHAGPTRTAVALGPGGPEFAFQQ